MGAEKRRRFQPDPRTWLLLCLLGIAAILVIRSEIGCLCLFLACLLIHMLAGNGGKILPYGLYYLIFYGIGWLGVHLMDSGVAFSVSSMLSSIGIVSRKVLVPLSFVICLAGEPTGSLMAALQKLHLPKAAGIGTAVVLRFFPTIAGEYRAIRSSQRFRGIGVGVLHTLTHLPTTVEYILIPLILREICLHKRDRRTVDRCGGFALVLLGSGCHRRVGRTRIQPLLLAWNRFLFVSNNRLQLALASGIGVD